MRISDWSSDVCSSDLAGWGPAPARGPCGGHGGEIARSQEGQRYGFDVRGSDMVGAGTSLSTLGERLPFHPPATTCLRYPAPTYTSVCPALRRPARHRLEHQAGAVHSERLALGGRARVHHSAGVGGPLG